MKLTTDADDVMDSSSRAEPINGSRLAIANWYMPVGVFVWGVAASGLVGWGVALDGVLGALVVVLGIAAWTAVLSFPLLSLRAHVRASAESMIFVGRLRRVAIPIFSIAHISRELNGDLLAEIYLIRSLAPWPWVYHIRVEFIDGETRDFEEICGLRRPTEHLVARLNKIVREHKRRTAR